MLAQTTAGTYLSWAQFCLQTGGKAQWKRKSKQIRKKFWNVDVTLAITGE
jgi:hypothetical protein